jgi:diguanylate cyclase (GGDEF)-like protein
MEIAPQPAAWRTRGRALIRGATADLRDAVAGHTLLLFSLMLALTVLWTGDALEVTPGYEVLVNHPAFPYFHETHDLIALALTLYVAHELQPVVGAAGILWFAMLHVPVWMIGHEAGSEIARFLVLTVVGLFGVYLISQRKRFQDELAHQAVHDPLTDLPNRRHLHEELARRLAESGRGEPGQHGAVVFIDLDGFKYVNDRLGHRTGDELLVNVADFLRQFMRDRDVLIRLGGDEFAVILPGASETQAHAAAARLVQGLEQHPRRVVGRAIPITASAGVALYPRDGVTVEEVLANADIAMHQAKDAGRNRVHLYTRDKDWERFESLLRWEQRIRDAVRTGRFPLYCQPIIDLRTGRTQHYELLLRMSGPDNQIIAPEAFLDIAGRFGLMQTIDRIVVRRAVEIAEHQRAQGRVIALGVNLSNGILSDREFPGFLAGLLAASSIDPAQLILEITETSTVANLDQAKEFMHAIKALGCRFALDDFGVGSSTFHQLRHLPVDFLKIDGAFIRDLSRTHADRHLVQAIVNVAQGLGRQTIAEYVGDEESARLLRELGVDFAQGYHIGWPRPVEELLPERAPAATVRS